MEKLFIYNTMAVATYVQNAETSFYRQESESVLPNRISITKNGKQINEVRNTGRMLNKVEKAVGDLIATFTRKDNSPYKLFKPYSFRSKIFQSVDYPQFVGYATPAISNEDGKATNEIGMLVIHQPSDTMYKLFFVPGATMNDKLDILEAVDSYINKEGGL